MPELPDVEMFKNYVKSTSLLKKIEKVQVNANEMLHGVSSSRLKKTMIGARFQSARRHGKYLFVQMDNGKSIIFHFGMTGFLKYFKKPGEKPSHCRLIIYFSNGYRLAYDCQRKLGLIGMTGDVGGFIAEKGLGPDPCKTDFDFTTFKDAFKRKKGAVKSTLMNQHVIAGIGNIYSDEILFQAEIHPKTIVPMLDDASLKRIYSEMKNNVLPVAIKAGAQHGKFPSSFIIPHRSRDRKCPKCGSEILHKKVSGRTAYFCPRCQVKQTG